MPALPVGMVRSAPLRGIAVKRHTDLLRVGEHRMILKRILLTLCIGGVLIAAAILGAWSWSKGKENPSQPQASDALRPQVKKPIQLQHKDVLDIPLIAKNEALLEHGAIGLCSGGYKSLERCDRGDYTDGMMRRARVVNEVYKEVCNQGRLDEAIKQSDGYEYTYKVTQMIGMRKWEYFTETRAPSVATPIDWVKDISLAWDDNYEFPESIRRISFSAHKLERSDVHRDLYSVEIYGEDIGKMEVERAFFNEEGTMIAYLRFRRGIDQYILLLDHMEIQEKLCMTF
jgi:hypothetical protein